MPTLQVQINVRGQPARHVFVEHLWRVPLFPIAGPLALYMTDGQGHVRDEYGNLGIESFGVNRADIRILGQNSVARIVEGHGSLLVTPIWVDRVIHDGSVINLTDPDRDKADHFDILNLAFQNYDQVHRRFLPFSRNGLFPLGRQNTLQSTKDQAQRIEIVFPDNLPQDLAFCEPMSLATGYPLIHIKGQGPHFDSRLFGDANHGPTLIPSELSHAMHFSLLDRNARGQAEGNYVRFLLSQLASGNSPFHGMGIRTSATVAYIEAMDHFSSRFSEFLRLRPNAANPPVDFLLAELNNTGPYWLANAHQAGRLVNNIVTPNPGGTLVNPAPDDEGTIYGAIFLDFAWEATLETAVCAYFQSNALTFGQYNNWVQAHMPRHRQAIEAVARRWRL